jgi:hypothetical protein
LAKIGVPAQQEQGFAIEFLYWNNLELGQRVSLPDDDAMLFGEEVQLTQSALFFLGAAVRSPGPAHAG